MADRLLTENQMSKIREVALLGMVTDITIERRSAATPPVGGDYGDDFLTYTITNDTRRKSAKGWLHSEPSQVQQVDSGSVVTVNTYRLFLPVGTDILAGDHVTIGSDEYTVSDTTAEGTWLPLLTCNLRKRE